MDGGTTNNKQIIFVCTFLNTFGPNCLIEVQVMNKQDNRVRYTKAVLREALMELLLTKHIDKVTVKELCEKAQINRGTFYLHYTMPNDLLMEIEAQFFEENMNIFTNYIEENYETGIMSALFTGILKNRDVCRVIMGKNGSTKFMEKVENTIRGPLVSEWHRAFPQYSKDDLDYIFDYIFSGSMRLILNWIEDDSALPAEELARRLDRLAYHSQLAIAEFAGTAGRISTDPPAASKQYK